MKATARLYIRIVMPDGSRPYCTPVYTANGKLRAQYASISGNLKHHPEGVYYLRYTHGGKRRWEPVGSDPSLALVRLQQHNHLAQAGALGITAPHSPVEVPPPASAKSDQSDRPLHQAAAEYLAETKEHKSRKTYLAYCCTLTLFLESCRKNSLKQIERQDVLAFMTFLKRRGNAARTVRNRVDYLQIFLHHFGIPSVLEGKDLPRFTEKLVSAYSADDIRRLLAAADLEEQEVIQFFLCTGVREQEAQFSTWRDVDFSKKTFTVSEKLDLNFTPKDKEEGEIPIPDALVEMLRARHQRYPKARLIFPSPTGGSNGHFLRTIKRIGFRAGMNCGHCYNKAGLCCENYPVCRRILLHRFRKTFATMHHKNGMPVRTIMKYLRHSDLETTLLYLATEDDEQTRGIVNGTFAAFSSDGRVQLESSPRPGSP